MRSRHADRFNHDEDAPEYDLDVRNEEDPIRAGYAELLEWVAREASIGPDARVLELGSGTGNLTALLPPARELLCVDISGAMTHLAREKLARRGRLAREKLARHGTLAREKLARRGRLAREKLARGEVAAPAPAGGRSAIRFIEADLLECLSPPHASAEGSFDAVLSTYALHHLVPDERALLFAELAARLAPGGRIVIGDLMFESAAERERFVSAARRRGEEELAETVEDEFFWLLDQDVLRIESLGLRVATRRVSDLSWGLLAERA
jgi:SAM-dependent methyltransferase